MTRSLIKKKITGNLCLTITKQKHYYVNTHTYITYSLVSRPVKGVVTRMSNVFTCREEYVDMFRLIILRQLNYKSNLGTFGKHNPNDLKCCTKKAYIAVRSAFGDSELRFLKSMVCALDIINVLEERHGWPLTTMYKINNQKDVVFCGTNKWIKSPFALSLYTLLMRIGETSIMRNICRKTSNKYKRYDCLVDTIRKIDTDVFIHTGLYKPIIKRISALENRTLFRVCESINFWDRFVGKYDILFKGRSFLSNYGYISVNEYCKNKEYGPNIHVSNSKGIKSLIDNDATDLEMCRRFKRLGGKM